MPFADGQAADGVADYTAGTTGATVMLTLTLSTLGLPLAGVGLLLAGLPISLALAAVALIYIAVSATNGCEYCTYSHTAAARAKGMTDAQHAELMAIIGLAAQTNHLVTAMQLPPDEAFLV